MSGSARGRGRRGARGARGGMGGSVNENARQPRKRACQISRVGPVHQIDQPVDGIAMKIPLKGIDQYVLSMSVHDSRPVFLPQAAGVPCTITF